jgi:hypothetical protein
MVLGLKNGGATY